MKKEFCFALAALAVSACMVSCSNDDGPSYSEKAVTNTELMTVLKAKGFQFNEQGQLLLDDLANATTTLDLSGTNLDTAALKGLNILPNLTEVNLQNNGYGPVFNVGSLPTQITGIDLRGNNIYDFEGLISASVVNDEVQTTILHKLTKLYLPASAKWNVEDLMPFYTKNQADGTTVDMQMVDDSGSLQAYTTLREVPDEYFRAYLKMLFPSLFADDTHMDISKPMSLTEQGTSISLWYQNQYADIALIESIEGIEYFINNPYYKTFYVSIGDWANKNLFEVSYLMPRDNIKCLSFSNATSPKGIDLTKATSLSTFIWSNNPYIEELDLSNTIIANQNYKEFDSSIRNILRVNNFENLKKIILPQNLIGVISEFTLIDLPVLESIDISQIEAMDVLTFINLPKCSITYPNLKQYYSSAYGELYDFNEDEGWQVGFCISEDVYNMESTKSFIENHSGALWDNFISYRNDGAYRWQ